MTDTQGSADTGSWFDVLAGDPRSPALLHVPHASRVIPGWVRAGIVLGDQDLAIELDAMTDAHTDLIAAAVSRRVACRPWQFVNRTLSTTAETTPTPGGQSSAVADSSERVTARHRCTAC